MFFDARHRYVISQLVESYGLAEDYVEKAVWSYKDQVEQFFQAEGPHTICWFYQPVLTRSSYNDQENKEPALFLGQLQAVSIGSKMVYFIRTNPKGITEKTSESDMCAGEVGPEALRSYSALLSHLYVPLLAAQGPQKGPQGPLAGAEGGLVAFLKEASSLSSSLCEAVDSLKGGCRLEQPSTAAIAQIDMQRPGGLTRAAGDPELVGHFLSVLRTWTKQCTELLDDAARRTAAITADPRAELDYWRKRVSALDSIMEQLKSPTSRATLSLAGAARSPEYDTWRAVESRMEDARGAAQDNAKYLAVLLRNMGAMYTGTPSAMAEALPSMLGNIKMMAAQSRCYSKADAMTDFLAKVIQQAIKRCKEHLTEPGALWQQQRAELLHRLQQVLKFAEYYQAQFSSALEAPQGQKSAAAARTGAAQHTVRCNRTTVLDPMAMFAQRCAKLHELFTTVEQFSSLHAYVHVEGMLPLVKEFDRVVQDLKDKPYDLLDTSSHLLDRDLLEFNVNIHELEGRIQAFVDASFMKALSTEHALALLRQFQVILQRQSLRAELEQRYSLIFEHYCNDLTDVQTQYEKYKNKTPPMRHTPPVAGNILWARQLLQRIRRPMERFQEVPGLLDSKEAKKVVKQYNRMARTLVEFEMLWHDAWAKSVEAARARLQAPLLVRHPETSRLFVNLDKDITSLMAETRYLLRMGVDVPDGARVLLMQEAKFKAQFAHLHHLLQEYSNVLSSVPPVLSSLMAPHLEELEAKIAPGLAFLTWTSLNIDGYLTNLQTALTSTKELIGRCNAILTHRVSVNLSHVKGALLVVLPQEETLAPEAFVSRQQQHTQECVKQMTVWQREVGRALEELLHLLNVAPDAPVARELWTLYKGELLQAVAAAVQRSLSVLQHRLEQHPLGNNMGPLFSVDVTLSPPNITMRPSLEDVSACLDAVARGMLEAPKGLDAWPPRPDDTASVTDGQTAVDVSGDAKLLDAAAALQGSIQRIKAQVEQYVLQYKQYGAQAGATTPEDDSKYMAMCMEDLEVALKHYSGLEAQVADIPSKAAIGPLMLEMSPLKAALRSECIWAKTRFSSSLHSRYAASLKGLEAYIRESANRLARQVNDLEDVQAVMDALREIREREALIDTEIIPIEEVYALLARHEVKVPKEETDMVSDLRYSWKALRKKAVEVSDRLLQLQPGLKQQLQEEVTVFVEDAKSFCADWDAQGPMVPGLEPLEAVDRLRKFQQLFEGRKRKWQRYTAGEELFGLPTTSYPKLEKAEGELNMMDRLYSLYLNVITAIKGYGEMLWVEATEKLDNMLEQVNSFQAQAKKMPKGLRAFQAYHDCTRVIDQMLELLPLFKSLAHRALQPRHWDALQKTVGVEFNMAPDQFRLSHLLNGNLQPHKEALEEICSAAVQEEVIENKMKAIIAEWSVLTFTFADYSNRGPVVLKASDTSELIEKLEESQMVLGSMATNRYSHPFRDELQLWIGKLSAVDEQLERWLGVQSLWMYMETVFSGGDIVKQLPAEAKRFQGIDKNFMRVVANAQETKVVVDTCCGNELLQQLLPHLLEQLEICQKSLSAYLEAKRSEFPRFYFVSDPVLLEILSLGSDPPSVVPHFQSGLFDSLANVSFDPVDKSKMIEMHSQQGEKVKLETPVEAKGNVEVWLQRLVDGMQATMRSVIRRATRKVYELPLPDFLFGFPAQVALLGLQFMWTTDTQDALMQASKEKGALMKAQKKADALLREMVQLTLSDKLTPMQRTNLETCITVHMHQKETTDELVKKKIRDPQNFEWLKQCRFYWREDTDDVIISISDVDFEYSYEYLGVKERLVITPLTDVCYITLSQALGMFLGGAPAGPAGTGKTETTKDLGATLGKYVVVFNCSDQMDYKGMGKIYKGLAQSGLWGCFDEFNRINLEVLSVCAQQLYCILSAVRDRKKQFTFVDGSTVSLDPRVGFFITMNPGYAGRQELPENLKALFRGVTMMVPNRQIIMKVKLAACGYQENDVLSKKFFVLYGLCEQQLSKQAHYDFGLRNILSVLRTAGASKRTNPEKSEVTLMMRTLRDMNMSKFVAEDVPLFLSLIDDLFPGIKAERAQFANVQDALLKVVERRGLVPHPTWLNKCIQLYETYLVRHGIMVVGPSGTGKTSMCECLAAALTELGQKHVLWRMNPKAITAPQMFGRMDAATGDWTDGVFAVLWRRAARAKNQHTWIVLDGPVDTIWIENLNTVLDDNKVLTLANGDRILMTSNMKAFFEPENLNNASPATVSRAGIIYVSADELGWEPVVTCWLAKRRESEAAVLRECFDKLLGQCLEFVRKNCRNVMPIEATSQVGTLLTLLEATLAAAGAPSGAPTGAAAQAAAPTALHMQRVFVYCLMWSIGGLVEGEDRLQLDVHLRTLCEPLGDVMPRKEQDTDTAYEYFVHETSGDWHPWRTRVPTWQYPQGGSAVKFSSLFIPTLDSVRYEALLSAVHAVGRAALLVGGPGTAKTCTVNQFLGRFSRETHSSKTITFSYFTTPQIFQMAVEGVVEKRQGKTYAPPAGKTLTIFVDDLAMPAINEWGDQVTNEAVRQLLEQGGLYSLQKPIGDMKFVVDTRYVGCMGKPGGGNNDIPNRLKRHFAVFNVPLPSTAAINDIFMPLMEGRFSSSQFEEEVVSVTKQLVPLTVALWNKVGAKMLPTPAKFHYIFNMRDLSKIFHGILSASTDRFQRQRPSDLPFNGVYGGNITSAGGYLLSLWQHEAYRVFCDKLITQQDKEWVESAIKDLARTQLPGSLVDQIEQPMLFADFLRDPIVDDVTGEIVDAHPSAYEAVPGGLDMLKTKVEALQKSMNEETRGPKQELVLFNDALAHLTRITRTLMLDRASALLVGVGGSGKQSLAKLAAYIAGAQPFQIQLTKTYSVSNLLEDIKALYKIAGIKGQKVCFTITDADIKEEAFLEYINQLLMTGEVAGLFAKDEMDAIINDVRPVMKKERPGVPDSYDELYSFFMGRVRDRLHVCLCFSPVGDKFARRAMQFPGLINGCTIDWFLPWPEDALKAVSSRFIDQFEMECPGTVKESLKRMMAGVHASVTKACQEYYEKYCRHVYVTPRSYLSFIRTYQELYRKRLEHVQKLAAQITAGLAKMNEAKVDVERMKVELAVKQEQLAVSAAEAEALLHNITESTATAEKEKQRVMGIVEQVSVKAAEIAVVKDDAERDLAAAQPALDAAVASLNSISPKDITSLKALKNPPDVIKRIFDCVLLLRHLPVQKVRWQDVKGQQVLVGTYDEAVKAMSDIQFLSKLMNFPKEAINDETVELLQPYFAASDFNFESAKKASGSVAGLCNWAAAMCTYHEVAKVVDPKIIKLRAAEEELQVAQREKQKAEDNLAQVVAALAAMQQQFDEAMRNKQALEDDASATQCKMDSANLLLHELSGEEVRWSAQSSEFQSTIQRLTGDCALAAAFVSYLGGFNKEFRELLLQRDFLGMSKKLGIPVTQDLQISKMLVDDSEVGDWGLQGLPQDELSVQNGIMVTRATRYPLLIDPQGQGRTWLYNKEASRGMKVVGLGDKHLRHALEESLINGTPLLIENVPEDIDPLLDPILEQRYIRKGKNLMVKLGDKDVDVSPGFCLYMTCRLPNPHFSPELCAKVALVDFTVTIQGLEDQLLNTLILKEKQDLEQQRLKLIEEVNSYQKRIKQLEDDLLFRLSNSKGNLLDDTELINVLAVTKQTAQEVTEKLQTASATNKKITDACEEYRPVARRAQQLYFLISEFSTVDRMYQTGLAAFLGLYWDAIANSEVSPLAAKRIAAIINYLTWEVYCYITRGLFERHKLVFALMLANKIGVAAGDIKQRDINVLLQGGGTIDLLTARKKLREWLPDAVWANVLALAEMDAFRDLPDVLGRNDAAWRAWYESEAPETAKIPEYEDKISKFERMCIVKAFREDRTLVSAQSYISTALGQRYVDSIPLNMEKAWTESKPRVPIICLLSPGADPTKLIEDLAKRKKIRTLGVSMGQGQEVIARKYIVSAMAEGHWVLLQNAHLGLGYLQEVEQLIAKGEGTFHEGFRLWVTAEPHPAFPIGLLQCSIKVTNEAPVGIKAGLRASYRWITQDTLDIVPRYEWRQLLFVQAFLHSVVQERRKFGPIGWNQPYEFNMSDLSACVQFLQNHLLELDAKKGGGPSWETVQYMVAAIQYGGRITDDFDKLLMMTYAAKFYFAGVLERNYMLFADEKAPGGPVRYSIPDGSDIEIFRKAIEELPANDNPGVFGMHPNADLAFRTLQVTAAFQTIIDTQPKGGGAGAGGMTKEALEDKMAEDLLTKIPAPFAMEATREALKKLPGGASQPLTIHLRQEIERLNIIIGLATKTLTNLRLALAGTIALSGPWVEAMDALALARVPAAWVKKSWEAPSIGTWTQGLLMRHQQLHKWLNNGRPKSYWLTGFFNPQGFLTAMKQEVTRKHSTGNDKWALDDVVMVSEVVHPSVKDPEALKDGPSEGVYIHGLYLDGAAWSHKDGRLADQEPMKLYAPLPVLHVTGVLAKDAKIRTTNVYECPVYRTKKRTGLNFVAKFQLRTDDDPNKWILRGTSLLCSID